MGAFPLPPKKVEAKSFLARRRDAKKEANSVSL